MWRESGTLPEHLSLLIENKSMSLKWEEKERVVELIREFQEIVVGPDGMVGQTNLVHVTHKIGKGDSALIRLPPATYGALAKRNS